MTAPSRPTVALHEPVEAQLRPLVAAEFAAAGLDCAFLAADVTASAGAPHAHRVVAAVVGPPVPVTADIRTTYPAVRVVVTPSVGTDHIDVPALLRLGIPVVHLTDYCTREVADHTVALVLASLRRLSDGDRAVRSGRWVLPSTPRLVAGTTLGLVGFGRIARAVAHRALALDMRVVAFDTAQADEVFTRAGVARASTLSDLLRSSEVVSLHLPLTDRTRHLIDAAALAEMMPGSILINVSRGGLVDEQALAAALADERLSCAGIDTFETEPPSTDDDLLARGNAVFTPHVAWLSEGSPRRAIMQSVALAIDALATTDHASMPLTIGERMSSIDERAPVSITTERQARVALAAVYRLIAHFGMTDLIFTHVSMRLPGHHDRFLINPYGLLFEEITASNLVVVDLDGRTCDDGPWDVNPAGFVIHSAVHAARPDATCVVHTHTRAGCAVAAQRDGLLPLNQMALEFYGDVGYHEYEGIAFDLDERGRLVESLGAHPVLILRNHGLLTVGASPAQAFLRMLYLHRSCEIQLAAQAGGVPLHVPSQRVIDHTAAQFRGAAVSDLSPDPAADLALAWAALLRLLDRTQPGYDS